MLQNQVKLNLTLGSFYSSKISLQARKICRYLRLKIISQMGFQFQLEDIKSLEVDISKCWANSKSMIFPGFIQELRLPGQLPSHYLERWSTPRETEQRRSAYLKPALLSLIIACAEVGWCIQPRILNATIHPLSSPSILQLILSQKKQERQISIQPQAIFLK